MDFKEIKELIKLVEKSHVSEIRIADGDFRITIRTKEFTEAIGSSKTRTTEVIPVTTQAVAQPVNQPPADSQEKAPESESEKTATADNHLEEVKSPMVGTFYRSPAPDKPPYVKVGDIINPGDVVCIIEAMKLFNEIESEVAGKIVKVLVDDATPVEYDQPLFLVDTSGV